MNDDTNQPNDSSYNPYGVSAGNSPFADSANQNVDPKPSMLSNTVPTDSSPVGTPNPTAPTAGVAETPPMHANPMQQTPSFPNAAPQIPSTENQVQTSSSPLSIPQSTESVGNQPAMPAQPNSSLPSQQNPSMDQGPSPGSSSGSPMNKKRVLLFVGIFLVLVVALTAGYIFLTGMDDSGSSENLDEQSQVMITDDAFVREPVTYAATDLISKVTTLANTDAYMMTGSEMTTGTSGCNYNRNITVHKYIENFSTSIIRSFPDDVSGEACAFEGTIAEELELYSIEDYQTVALSDVPEGLMPQSVLNDIVPYTTLLTVSNAYKTGEGITEIVAKFSTSEQSGTYTFFLNSDNMMESFTYELTRDSANYTSKGEINIEYISRDIVLPAPVSAS